MARKKPKIKKAAGEKVVAKKAKPASFSGRKKAAPSHKPKAPKVRKKPSAKPEPPAPSLPEKQELTVTTGRRSAITVESVLSDAKRLKQFLEYLKIGASFSSACMAALKIRYETLRRWLIRGNAARQGPYRRLYRHVMQAVGEAAVVAEAQVRTSAPLVWLERGPGRWAAPEWSEGKDPELSGGESSGKGGGNAVGFAPDQVKEALAHLRDSGVDLNQLSLDQSKLRPGAVIDGTASPVNLLSDDEESSYDSEPQAEDDGTNKGVNYVGEGRWKSTNDSLPPGLKDPSSLLT